VRAAGRLLAAVAGTVALAGAGAACSASTGLTNNTVAGCVRSLPVATAAIHDDHAKLLGVHRVSADRLPARVKAGLPREDDTTVCAIAFRGTFAAGQVTDARAGATGTYAVVLVDARRLTVVGSFVGSKLPKGLKGHLI
jgi:hypothetical protein